MDITLQELLTALNPASPVSYHPLCGKPVLVVSTNGFVHTGVLHQEGPHLYLREAANIRYWAKRDGGLPELAREGFITEDKIDPCHSLVWLNSIVFMMERKP